METVLVFLVLLAGTIAQDVPVFEGLPPPVKPQPRFSVTPETRQSSCRYSFNFGSVGQKVLLQSPNWSNEYQTNADCTYTLTSLAGTRILLECTEFNVEASQGCAYDYFYFSLTGDSQFRDSMRTCGRGSFNQTSTGNAMTIGFKSDGSNPYSAYPLRFQCSLTAISTSGSGAVASTTRAPPPPTTVAPTRTPTTNTSASCTCGQRNEVPRIVGGEHASVNEFPWRCNLFVQGMGVFCGATLISSQWVLTAAHCTAAIPSGSVVYVDCADHDISSATDTTNVLAKVVQIIQHASYNSESQDNDISLLKLETPLAYSRTVQPVCLPWKMVGSPVNGLTVTASGWGTTSSGGQQSVILKKVDLPVVGTAECQRYYGTSITNNMICTYRPGSDTCQGDSGGSIDYKDPATGRYLDLGVVSWGVGCAGTNQPGVYAQVTNYLPWIQANTGDNFCRV